MANIWESIGFTAGADIVATWNCDSPYSKSIKRVMQREIGSQYICNSQKPFLPYEMTIPSCNQYNSKNTFSLESPMFGHHKDVKTNPIDTPNDDRIVSNSVNNGLYNVNGTFSGKDKNRLMNSPFANISHIKKLKNDSHCLIDQFYECVPPPTKPTKPISIDVRLEKMVRVGNTEGLRAISYIEHPVPSITQSSSLFE